MYKRQVTQRDGVTYGLYSNGGATGQKIKVTGEVCSYEPYGGKAVTIDTTDPVSYTHLVRIKCPAGYQKAHR